MSRTAFALALALAAIVALAACSHPEVPDKDKPVDPQATRHDPLARAIDAPLEKARDVQATLDAAKAAQDAAIDTASDASAAGR